MRSRPLFLLLVLCLTVTGLRAGPDRLALAGAEGEALAALVARQRALLAEAAKAEDRAALEDFRKPLQDLVNDYEDFLKAHPDLAAAHVAYALFLKEPLIDERRRAVALLLKANQLDKDLPVVKNELGNFLAEDGKPREALNYYLSAVALAPDEPLYHFQVARLLREARADFEQSGEWTRAAVEKAMVEGYAKASELAPDSLIFAFARADVAYEVEAPDWEEALRVWRSIAARLEVPVEVQTIRIHEARVLGKLGRLDEARAVLDRVTEARLQEEKQKRIAELAGGGEK